MNSTMELPERFYAAYVWVNSAGEIPALRAMDDASVDAYADECETNAREHNESDVTASDIVALAMWLRKAGR